MTSKGIDAVTIASETLSKSSESSLPDLIPLLNSAAEAANSLRDRCREAVAGKVSQGGKIDGDALEREQHAAHGLAWIATYAEALNQIASYARRMSDEGRFGEMEALLAQIGAAEYASQLAGGVPMSQGEIARTHELGVSEKDQTAFLSANVRDLIAATTPATRARAIALIRGSQGAVSYGDTGLDETITAMREEMHRFSEAEVVPHAQDWHLKDEYVPMELIGQMAELGVFALTLPEEYGGLGLGKEAMCVVSEELSRGYIGVGSLGTRSEIAEELILNGGTDAQKQEWLPRIASGESAAHGGVHRAQHRLRPRLAHHPRGEGRRCLSHHRAEDLDHPRRPRRPHDRARPHQSIREGLSRAFDVLGTEAARHRRQSLPGRRHDRRRDRGARLSRHEGVRHLLRRLRRACRQSARAGRGPGLQAADADLRGGAHPDRGARHRRGPGRARSRLALRHRAHPVRQADRRASRASPTSS